MPNPAIVTPDIPRAVPRNWRMPQETSIVLVLLGIALIFEALGWIERGQSFLYNPQGLLIMVLRVSEIGLIAVGVTMTTFLPASTASRESAWCV